MQSIHRQDRQKLAKTEQQIEALLDHPGMSNWLKDAMRSALDRDPVEVLNDLEFLNHILRARCEVLAARMFEEHQQSPV